MITHRISLAGAVMLVLACGGNVATQGNRTPATEAQPRYETAAWTPVKVPGPAEHPPELLTLAAEFRAWRDAESSSGVPDYAAEAARHKRELPAFRQRLDALKIEGWGVHQKIDYLLLRSEMDALYFDLTVDRAISRDPSFYTEQAIGNVYRLLTGDRRFRGDPMPYTKARAQGILKALGETANYMEQARRNLTEAVPELADVARRQPFGLWADEGNDLPNIVRNYENWARRTAEYFPQPEASQLVTVAIQAGKELQAFDGWLQQNRPRMKGKYAMGKDALEWYDRHVLLLPYSTDQLMLMADLERARALSMMQMEMQKNRRLPQLDRPRSPKEFLDWDTETALLLRRWYRDDEQILTDREDMPDMRTEQGEYIFPFGWLAFTTERKPGVSRVLIPPPEQANVKGSYYGFFNDPGTLHGHEYWPGHTLEALIRKNNPCPIRRAHRDEVNSQGWCFYNEELPVLLNFPYVRGPRTREIVYGVSMVIRAWRITLGIKVVSGEMTPEEAYRAFNANVPSLAGNPGIVNAWREVDPILTRASGLDHCQTGKLQIFKLLADRRMQLNDKFDLRQLHDQILRFGQIPLALLRWEITGLDDEAKQFWQPGAPLRGSADDAARQ
jgi:Bacterial protein of unknown function (DUF885)